MRKYFGLVLVLAMVGSISGCASCPHDQECGNPLLELVLWKHWKHSCRKYAWQQYKGSKKDARYSRDLAVHEAKTKYREAKKQAKDQYEQDVADAKSQRDEALEQCKWGVLVEDGQPIQKYSLIENGGEATTAAAEEEEGGEEGGGEEGGGEEENRPAEGESQ